MRHQKATVKLNRTTSHRNAMFRNMVTSLFRHERLRTTDAKAKELRRWADNMITLAKRGDLHARRQALSIIREKDVVHKLFEEAAERYGAVSGGYTRVVKLGRRPGDAAPVSLIELISPEKPKKKTKTKKKKKETPVVEKHLKAEETAADEAEAAEPSAVDTTSEAKKAAPVEEKTDETAEAAESETVLDEMEQQPQEAAAPEETGEVKPEAEANEDTPEDPDVRQ